MAEVGQNQKSHYHPTGLLATRYYNNVEKKRGVYLAPYKSNVCPFHVWNSLVEKAGYKLSDAPKTWDAYWDFFKPIQKKLRDQGMRGVYALGLHPTTTCPHAATHLLHASNIAYDARD